MPRRRSSKSSSTEKAKSTTRRRTRGVTRRKTLDASSFAEKYFDLLSQALMLDFLEVPREVGLEIVKEVVSALAGESSYVSIDSMVSRIRRYSDRVNELIAYKLLELLDKLNEQQLEFIIAYGKAAAGKNAARLYAEALRLGRRDLLPQIRALWEMYGNPTPLECPYCGFRAVAPNLTCIICGREVKESDLKKANDFIEKLKLFAEEASIDEIKEALTKKAVLLGEQVKAPSAPRSPLDVELPLSQDEVAILKEAMFKKQASGL